MNLIKRTIASALYLSALLAMAGCSTGQTDTITTNLALAVDAAIAAAPAIEIAANASPAVEATVTADLSNSETCLTEAQSILAGTSTATPAQAATIVAACGAATITSFPPGTPTEVVALLTATSSAVGIFLRSLPPATVVTLQAHTATVNKVAAAQAPHLSKLNKGKLKLIRTKLKLLQDSLHKPVAAVK